VIFFNCHPPLTNPELIECVSFEETLKSAHCDFLNGLLTRGGAFRELFDQELSKAKRHNYDTTLIFFDLDNFKEVNDIHEHLAGDKVLQAGE